MKHGAGQPLVQSCYSSVYPQLREEHRRRDGPITHPHIFTFIIYTDKLSDVYVVAFSWKADGFTAALSLRCYYGTSTKYIKEMLKVHVG